MSITVQEWCCAQRCRLVRLQILKIPLECINWCTIDRWIVQKIPIFWSTDEKAILIDISIAKRNTNAFVVWVSGDSCVELYVRTRWYGYELVYNFEEKCKSRVFTSVSQWLPMQRVEHISDATKSFVVIADETCSPPLDTLKFIYILLEIWIPNCWSIVQNGEDKCLVRCFF